jgi:phosphoribosyl 1,2-cyclic phosphodiesterase
VKLHLDLATLIEQLPRMQPKRVVLTHMSDDMLSRIGTLGFETAYDGRVIEF